MLYVCMISPVGAFSWSSVPLDEELLPRLPAEGDPTAGVDELLVEDDSGFEVFDQLTVGPAAVVIVDTL